MSPTSGCRMLSSIRQSIFIDSSASGVQACVVDVTQCHWAGLERIGIIDEAASAGSGGGGGEGRTVARLCQCHDEPLVLWASIEPIEEIIDDPLLGIVGLARLEGIGDRLVAKRFGGLSEPVGGGGVVDRRGNLHPDHQITDPDDRPEPFGSGRFAGEDEGPDAGIIGGDAESAGVGPDEVGGEQITARIGLGGDVRRGLHDVDDPGIERRLADGSLGFEHGHADSCHSSEIIAGASIEEGGFALQRGFEVRAASEKLARRFHLAINRVGAWFRVGRMGAHVADGFMPGSCECL